MLVVVVILSLAIFALVAYIIMLHTSTSTSGAGSRSHAPNDTRGPPPQTTTIIVTDTGKNYTPPVTYGQLGYLTPIDDATGKKLPFYGDANPTRRGRYYYYTIIDDIKLPLMYNKRDCMEDIACDAVYDGDEVQVGTISYAVKIYGKRSDYIK